MPRCSPVRDGKTVAQPGACRAARTAAGLITAYREGLGLAAVAVIRGPAGLRIAAAEPAGTHRLVHGDAVAARWWCRHAADARRLAAAAMQRLRRAGPREEAVNASALGPLNFPGAALAAVETAARRLHIALYSDDEIAREAARIIARVEAEIESLRQTGELKAINRSYRAQRMKASQRGEKFVSLAQWFDNYKETLVRQLAAALRYS